MLGDLFSVMRAWRQDRHAMTLALVVLVWGSFVLTTTFSDRTADFWMDRYHLNLPFIFWAPMQLTPAMYCFENVASIRAGGSARGVVRWVNHHPTRLFHEAGVWPPVSRNTGCWDYELITRYRGLRELSHWRVCRSHKSVEVERVRE